MALLLLPKSSYFFFTPKLALEPENPWLGAEMVGCTKEGGFTDLMKLDVDARGLLSRGSLIAAPALCCCSCSSLAFCRRSLSAVSWYEGTGSAFLGARADFGRNGAGSAFFAASTLGFSPLGFSRSLSFSSREVDLRSGSAFFGGVTLCGSGSMPLKKGISMHCCAVGRFVGSQCMHERMKSKASGLAFGISFSSGVA